MYAETLQRSLFDEPKAIYPASMCVIGVGDAGCRAAFEVRSRAGTQHGVKVVCVDTDSTSLSRSSADDSLLLGTATLRGFGSGGDPAAAANAAEKSADTIRALVSGAECVMVVAGLGGGTGSGAAPVIASIARDSGALVISVAIMPFDFEGIRTHLQADDALDRLALASDVVLETPGGGQAAGGSTLSGAMEQVRRGVAGFASMVISIVTASSDQSNVTAAHLRSVFRDGTPAVFGRAEATGHTNVQEVAELCGDNALAGRASRCEIDRAIILIESGPEPRIGHVASVMAAIETRLGKTVTGAAPELHLGVSRSRLRAGVFRVSLVGTLSQVRRPLIFRNLEPASSVTTNQANSVAYRPPAGAIHM